jgi:LysM repeat protein
MNMLWRLVFVLLALQGINVAAATETAHNNTWGVYTVVKGDSLWSIAQKHPGATVASLAQANNIANPALIRPNMKLVITATHLVNKPARKVTATRKTMSVKTEAPCVAISSCDALRAIDRLGYPENVAKHLKKAVSDKTMLNGANAKHLDVVGVSYSAREGNTEYTFTIARKCTFKKTIRILRTQKQSTTDASDAQNLLNKTSPYAENEAGAIGRFTVLMRYKPERSRFSFFGKTTKKEAPTFVREHH